MDRVRVAKELVRLARELVGSRDLEYLQDIEEDIQRKLDNLRTHVKKYSPKAQGALNKATRVMSQAVSYLNEAQQLHK